MKFLLTNDDGYLAPGINALKKILEKYGEVYMVAPHTAKSGMSCAISFFNKLAIHNIDDHTWSVEGTPADCAMLVTKGNGSIFPVLKSSTDILPPNLEKQTYIHSE